MTANERVAVAAAVVAILACAVWAAGPTSSRTGELPGTGAAALPESELPRADKPAVAAPPTDADLPIRPVTSAPVASMPSEMVGKTASVVLKNGAEVTADVLKRDGRSLVVDLGFTVIQVPLGDISRVTLKGQEDKGPQTAPAHEEGVGWQLYRTAHLERTTIEKAAHQFGEGVVMVSSPNGLGSGFIISPDGYLVTNYHVIANETKIKVTVFRRTEQGYEQKPYKKVKIIALNPFVDLALLKIEDAEQPLKYVYLGRSEEVEAGQDCFAIGNPLGLTRSVSQGIISTKNRNFEGQLYIQTTADINPGNSGGPLFNLRGEVIGVTSMGYIFLSGLNFAIPVDVVKRFIENRDAFAYDEDSPNSGYRYIQPSERVNKHAPPPGRLPELSDATGGAPDTRS